MIPHDHPSPLPPLSGLIEQSKAQAVAQVNFALTLLFWQIGTRINECILGRRRAEYGKQVVSTLSRELTTKFGKDFEEKNLRRMLQFAFAFPEKEIVVTVSRQLSWSHILVILPLKNNDARLFYANAVGKEGLSVRELRRKIEAKDYERTSIASLQNSSADPAIGNNFKDPYFLNFLGLQNSYLEKDLEDAILRELELFILELGKGFSFIERQKRMIIDGDNFYLDLLFYHRTLRRLVAIDLKLGKFEAKHKGQMELYLKWLDKYEKKEGEFPPIGLILCAERSKEQIELLEMQKDGIMVAEYWTELPPKKELEKKLHKIMAEARMRIEHRQ
ncbi:MAG: DUF1016 domain-containing protein [Citrobacter freundii]|nr:MAG: DUF1016 domain-containing protein [Citrobacter freundii]